MNFLILSFSSWQVKKESFDFRREISGHKTFRKWQNKPPDEYPWSGWNSFFSVIEPVLSKHLSSASDFALSLGRLLKTG